MNDSPARTDPEEAAVGRPTQTARRLVEASVSPNTRHAYAGALRRLAAWLDGRELHDVTLAAYLAELHDAGRASSSASMTVAAACFHAKLAGEPAPAGERTARVLAGYRRTAGDRGRGKDRRGRSGSRIFASGSFESSSGPHTTAAPAKRAPLTLCLRGGATLDTLIRVLSRFWRLVSRSPALIPFDRVGSVVDWLHRSATACKRHTWTRRLQATYSIDSASARIAGCCLSN